MFLKVDKDIFVFTVLRVPLMMAWLVEAGNDILLLLMFCFICLIIRRFVRAAHVMSEVIYSYLLMSSLHPLLQF